MSSKIWNKFSAKISDSIADARKNIVYLSSELKTNPTDGLSWWLKNKHQYEQVDQALRTLHSKIETTDFCLLDVYVFFTSFNFRDDDIAHAEWYQQAQNNIQALDKRLDAGDLIVPGIFRGVLNELRYISEADAFHKRWGLTSLQSKVQTMYEQLLEKVELLKTTASDAQFIQKKQLVIEQKRLELEKIKAQKEALQIQKEKALLLKEKVIEERQLREIRRQEHLEEQKLFQLKEQKEQAEAEAKRKEELQSSYADLANEWDSQVSNNN